jgi:hypothetical protein
MAGNEETAHVYEVAIDRIAPYAQLTGPESVQTRTRFDVTWSGFDGTAGSGLASFDVQVRDGRNGAWQDWLVQTQLRSAQFDAQRGHTYYFRAFARDQAGNRQTSASATKVLVQPVLNGGFDTGNLSDWSFSGELQLAVVPTAGPNNTSVLATRLGTEDYGPSLQVPGLVPVGSATIKQQVTIPEASQVQSPCLRFWYRVQTYDVIYSERLGRVVDTLDVTLSDGEGKELALLLRAGNPTNNFGELYDTGWQFASIDLKPFAGQTVYLAFANWNRHDNLLNTWSFVDDIRINECARTFAALTVAPGSGVASAAADAPADMAEAGAETPAVDEIR